MRFTGIPSGAPWLLGAVLGLLLMAPGSALAARCLDSSEPNDAADIASTQAVVEAACNCDGFSNHRQYVVCAKTVINAEIFDNNLRDKCKGLVKRIFRKSTCGHTANIAGEKIVCLRESSTGRPKCSVKREAACSNVTGGTFTQAQCLGAVFCEEEDKSGDFRVAFRDLATGSTPSGDNAACADVCGDGIVNGTEECDLGVFNNSDTAADTCRTNCLNPFCGDGTTDSGETCDGGAGNSDDPDPASGCRTDCTPQRCGDGTTDAGETCDDGDDGVTFGGPNCPSGNCDEADASCRTDCTAKRCGDNVVDFGELCDGTSASACTFPGSNGCNDPSSVNACKCASCGDTVVDAPLETCEPPSSGLCSKYCLFPTTALFSVGGLESTTISKGLLGAFTALPIGPQVGIFPLRVGPDLPGTGGVQSMVPLPTALDPINILNIATACVFILPLDPNDPNGIPPAIIGDAGVGWVDCDGSPGPNAGLGALGLPTDPNFSIYVDHCTAQTAPDPNQIAAPNPACDSNPVQSFSAAPNCAPTGGTIVNIYSGGLGIIDDVGTEPTFLCVPEQTAVDVGCASGTLDGFAGQFPPNAHGFQDPQNPACIGAGTGSGVNVAAQGKGIPVGSAFMVFNLVLDVRGTDPNDLACVPPAQGSPGSSPFTTGTATSGIMDAFATKGGVQAQTGAGVPFSCPDILFGGLVGPGPRLFSTAVLIDSTGIGPVPIDLNLGTTYVSQ